MLFVTATKAKAAAAGSEEKVLFDIVIGNEAGDCDSIVSSLLQAYYLSSTALGPERSTRPAVYRISSTGHTSPLAT